MGIFVLLNEERKGWIDYSSLLGNEAMGVSEIQACVEVAIEEIKAIYLHFLPWTWNLRQIGKTICKSRL